MKTHEIRTSFWETFPRFHPNHYKAIPYVQNGKRLYRKRTQNEYPCDIRCAFVEYVDSLARDGHITESQASRVTL